MVIAGGTVVTESAAHPLHIGISGGRIVALTDAAESVPAARERIDADGLVVVPGAIDGHTHFTIAPSDPEGEIEAGTRGAAAAGVTTVVEMPHSLPPATTLDAFLAKKAAFERRSVTDFGLWGGIDGATLGELPRMAAAGAAAMKGFLCSGDASGRAPDGGLPALDDGVLEEAMTVIAGLSGVIGLHAENHAILQRRMAALLAAGRHDALAHAEAGPEIAEIEAVARALFFARETGVKLHIVHMSSARAADLVAAARADVDVTVETCPQYLLLDEDDLVRIGADARCGPPLRRRAVVEALWRRVLDGRIDMLSSDHCPYRPEQKTVAADSIWKAAMGLTGIETAVPLFFGAAAARGLSLVDFARMTATAPARLYGFPRKGVIAIGADADLVLYDPRAAFTVEAARFHGPARWSAFEGMQSRGRPVRTLVRGASVFADGVDLAAPGSGRFVPRVAGAATRRQAA